MNRGPVMRANGVGTHAQDQRDALPPEPGLVQLDDLDLLRGTDSPGNREEIVPMFQSHVPMFPMFPLSLFLVPSMGITHEMFVNSGESEGAREGERECAEGTWEHGNMGT